MSKAKEILSGTDAQVAKAVKKLADRAMGAGMLQSDPKSGHELVKLFRAAAQDGDKRVVQTLAKKDLRDFILFAAEHGYADVVEGLIRARVDPSLTMIAGLRPINMAAKHGHVDVIEALVKAGDDPSYAGFFGKSVTLHAAEDDQVAAVETLVKLGAEVRVRDKLGGATLLILVAGRAGAELVRLIVERGADVNDTDNEGKTALMTAAEKGNLDAARELIRLGADVNAAQKLRPIEAVLAGQGGDSVFSEKLVRRMWANRQSTLLTPLMFAAGNGHAEVAEALIAAGAKVDAQEAGGRTAAKYAEANGHATVLRVLRGGKAGGAPEVGVRDLLDATEAGDLRRVRELLESGAVDVNGKVIARYSGKHDEISVTGGKPALVIAAENGHVEVVKELLQRGADVDALGDRTVFDNGQTALHAAAERGHLDVVRALIAAGANVNAKEKGRQDVPARTAMQLAVENRRKAVIAELLGAAPKDAKAKAKVPGLHEAAESGDEALVKRLIKAGADVNALATGTRWSPLMYAAFMGYAGAAKVLLDAGANVNLANRGGQTALSVAVHGAEMAPDVGPREKPSRSYVKTVRVLIAKGADPTVDTWDGETPLEMAKESGLKSLVSILQKASKKR